jgi:acyl-coenzyme A thioesterase PaaI-like protein
MKSEISNRRAISIAWSDPQPLAAAARTMPGIEFLRAIRDGRLPGAPIAQLLGFSLVEVEPGHAVFECTPGERHYNPIAEGRLEDAAGKLYAHASTTCIVLAPEKS